MEFSSLVLVASSTWLARRLAAIAWACAGVSNSRPPLLWAATPCTSWPMKAVLANSASGAGVVAGRPSTGPPFSTPASWAMAMRSSNCSGSRWRPFSWNRPAPMKPRARPPAS